MAHPFPEEAALRCRAGNMALKGNLPDKASRSYREALLSNPYLWEAFEGLCASGTFSILLARFYSISTISMSLQGLFLKSMKSSPRAQLPSKLRHNMKIRQKTNQPLPVLDSLRPTVEGVATCSRPGNRRVSPRPSE